MTNREYYEANKDKFIERSKNRWKQIATSYKAPDLEGEEWKPLVGFEKHYLASNMGRIKSLWRMKERIINGSYDEDGYRKITLTHPDGKQVTLRRARLIAETWIPNPDNKPEIDHINTIRTDDRVDNLRWVTSSENQCNPITLRKMSEWQKGKTKEEVRRKDND